MLFSISRLTMPFSHSVIMILARSGSRHPPILTPYVCSHILPLKEKTIFWQNFKINFYKDLFVIVVVTILPVSLRFKIMSKFSTLVKSETASNERNIYSLELETSGRICLILLAASKES